MLIPPLPSSPNSMVGQGCQIERVRSMKERISRRGKWELRGVERRAGKEGDCSSMCWGERSY